jgi:hypothetical protein
MWVAMAQMAAVRMQPLAATMRAQLRRSSLLS